MRKILFIVFAASFLVFASAHSGGTDRHGGHYVRSTGEYHYHHGYPAHQHPDGECPYVYDKGHAAGYSAGYSNAYNTATNKLESEIYAFKFTCTCLIIVLVAILLLALYRYWKNKKIIEDFEYMAIDLELYKTGDKTPFTREIAVLDFFAGKSDMSRAEYVTRLEEVIAEGEESDQGN